MKNIKKVEILLLLLFAIYMSVASPVHSLSSREDLFKNALDLSSVGKFSQALQQWNQYIDLFPEDAAAISNRGNVKLVLGNPKESIVDQDKAINLEPDLVDPYINRGLAEETLGLWAEAKQDYEFVIRMKKDFLP